MARIPFKLPDIGEGIAEAEIVAWHVKVGDMVEEDDPLADMMTDKATVEMTAPVSGRIVEIGGAAGDMLAIGAVLAVFESEADDAADAPSGEAPSIESTAGGSGLPDEPRPAEASPSAVEADARDEVQPAAETRPSPAASPQATDKAGSNDGAATASSPRVLASPAVRARAKDLGVDLADVKSARGDRVRHADLDAYLRYVASAPAARAAPATPAAAPAPRPADTARPAPSRPAAAGEDVEEIRVTGLRRRIAENMAEAKRRIPHFAFVEETDVTQLEALRQAMNAARGERPKLTLLPFLITAITRALPAFPMINARYDDEANIVSRHGAVHLGLATQTDAGLTVPVIRDAGARDVWALATEITRLADAARRGKATRDELSGSTITLTSLGPLGGIVSTPVINRPEVAIVGVNRIVERPAVVDGRIEVRKLMNLSSSFDHRVVDGWDAASFIQAVKRLIETPALLFVD
ncbi:dihydrolipoamide acetyltransferase family protein [Sphingomonas solaris]|uniref:Dihydrolipoamide acetyltransferase component of pyruvate dehydrogenase complex n=1 Tax=Alterirhizorhabdus solaris TaxID=2529389 RepID=A0A558R0F3_9SPHN|nr:dihydrolipoamide acetyltransferase family protein [Sphingomonas solaris]TVV72873.1 2-oxo acid dehydrogenase subunit E2 [Sphingomonas solaris]